MSAILVTGTDTGIGKTTVTCAIAAALVRRNLRVGVYKPVETGCAREHGRLFGADARRLLAAVGNAQTESSAAGYLFEMPAAPLAAARDTGESVDLGRLEREIAAVDHEHDITFVEGAGGLLVPIAERFTYLDLVRRLDLSVVVIVASKLGCVNHALLTLGALASAGARTLGYVLNTITAEPEEEPSPEANRELISAFSDAPCLGVFPYVPAEDRDDFALLVRLAESSLNLAALEQ